MPTRACSGPAEHLQQQGLSTSDQRVVVATAKAETGPQQQQQQPGKQGEQAGSSSISGSASPSNSEEGGGGGAEAERLRFKEELEACQRQRDILAARVQDMSILLQRQYELIASLGKVNAVGDAVAGSVAASELVGNLRRQMTAEGAIRVPGGSGGGEGPLSPGAGEAGGRAGLEAAGGSCGESLGEQVQRLELLGEGSFGKVYKGLYRGMVVAVKSVMLPSGLVGAQRRERMAILEAAICSSLSHPNIVQTYTYCIQPSPEARSRRASSPVAEAPHWLCAAGGGGASFEGILEDCGLEVSMVQEFSDCGSLRAALDRSAYHPRTPEPPHEPQHPPHHHAQHPPQHQGQHQQQPHPGSGNGGGATSCHHPLPSGPSSSTSIGSEPGADFPRPNYRAVLDTAVDVASGMRHLHELNVVHADLNACNVLLMSSDARPAGVVAKISDFGLSLQMDANTTHVSSLFGTLLYQAPEVLMEGLQSKAADIYSFGITLWELYTAGTPFLGVPHLLLAPQIARDHRRPVFPPHAPEAYVALAQSCWHPAASARPSFQEVHERLVQMREAEAGETPSIRAAMIPERSGDAASAVTGEEAAGTAGSSGARPAGVAATAAEGAQEAAIGAGPGMGSVSDEGMLRTSSGGVSSSTSGTGGTAGVGGGAAGGGSSTAGVSGTAGGGGAAAGAVQQGATAEALYVESPMERVLKLLQGIVHAEKVDLREAGELYEIILHSPDLCQPINIVNKMQTLTHDHDVNRSLLMLLTPRESFRTDPEECERSVLLPTLVEVDEGESGTPVDTEPEGHGSDGWGWRRQGRARAGSRAGRETGTSRAESDSISTPGGSEAEGWGGEERRRLQAASASMGPGGGGDEEQQGMGRRGSRGGVPLRHAARTRSSPLPLASLLLAPGGEEGEEEQDSTGWAEGEQRQYGGGGGGRGGGAPRRRSAAFQAWCASSAWPPGRGRSAVAAAAAAEQPRRGSTGGPALAAEPPASADGVESPFRCSASSAVGRAARPPPLMRDAAAGPGPGSESIGNEPAPPPPTPAPTTHAHNRVGAGALSLPEPGPTPSSSATPGPVFPATGTRLRALRNGGSAAASAPSNRGSLPLDPLASPSDAAAASPSGVGGTATRQPRAPWRSWSGKALGDSPSSPRAAQPLSFASADSLLPGPRVRSATSRSSSSINGPSRAWLQLAPPPTLVPPGDHPIAAALASGAAAAAAAHFVHAHGGSGGGAAGGGHVAAPVGWQGRVVRSGGLARGDLHHSRFEPATAPERGPTSRDRDEDEARSSRRARQEREAVEAVLKGPHDKLLVVLAKIDEWKFDCFELNDVTDGRPLSALAFALLRKCDLLPDRTPLNEAKLARFLVCVEDGYPDNPYHCRIHAADVVRCQYVLLTRGGVLSSAWAPPQREREAPLLCALLAAVIHDYQHKGVNNDFLIRARDPLALLYNDRSPLENHHLSAAFTLLKEERCNFLAALPAKSSEQLRKLVIEMVLATDMRQHFSLVSLFNSKLAPPPAGSTVSATQRMDSSSGGSTSGRLRRDNSLGQGQGSFTSQGAHSHSQLHSYGSGSSLTGHLSGGGGGGGGGGGAHGGSSTAVQPGRMDLAVSDELQSLVLQLSLKCADLGNLSAAGDVQRKWVQLLEEEMFQQGDRERAAGLAISPLMDRESGGVSRAQPGFFSAVAIPQFQTLANVFPGCAPMLEAVRDNHAMWMNESKPTDT